jgi:hypothetical protein
VFCNKYITNINLPWLFFVDTKTGIKWKVVFQVITFI